MASQKVRPSGWWYLLGVFMIILGFVLAAVVGVNGIVSLDDEVRGFGRVPVPGEAALELDDGDYTVYFEPTLGTSPDNEPNHGAMLGVVSITDPAGADVALEVYETNFEYSFGGESGFAILTFNAPSQGVYTVTATDAQAAGIAPAGQIAIGRSLTDGLGRTLLIAIGVFVLLLVVAIGVMIALAVMRGRSKKRIAAAAPQGFGSTDGRPPGAPPVPGAPPTGPPPPGWNSAPRATWPPPASDGAPPPGSAAPAGAPQGGSSVPPPWEQQPQQAPSTPPPWEQQPPPAPSPQAPQPNPHPPQAPEPGPTGPPPQAPPPQAPPSEAPRAPQAPAPSGPEAPPPFAPGPPPAGNDPGGHEDDDDRRGTPAPPPPGGGPPPPGAPR